MFSSPSVCMSPAHADTDTEDVASGDRQTGDVVVPASGDAGDVVVLVGSHDHRLYCLTAVSGSLVWSAQFDSELYATTTTLQPPSHSKPICQCQCLSVCVFLLYVTSLWPTVVFC